MCQSHDADTVKADTTTPHTSTTTLQGLQGHAPLLAGGRWLERPVYFNQATRKMHNYTGAKFRHEDCVGFDKHATDIRPPHANMHQRML
jgi:hypothetical protein